MAEAICENCKHRVRTINYNYWCSLLKKMMGYKQCFAKDCNLYESK